MFEPRSDRRDLSPGDPLLFDLLLVGRATELAAYALLAIERMAETGLGADRARFALASATVPAGNGAWQPIVKAGKVVAAAVALPQWTGGAQELSDEADEVGADSAVIRFLTPTRLKVNGQLASSAGFRTLAFTMLRRLLELAHFYAPGVVIDWDFARLLARTASVRVAASDLHWHDWQRYSNRQRQTMSLGGFVGSLRLEGDLTPFVPLLRSAEVLHVGKGATFGLGRIAVECLQG